MNIGIVDENTERVKKISEYLNKENFKIFVLKDVDLPTIEKLNLELLILSASLKKNFDLCKEIKKEKTIPILFISSVFDEVEPTTIFLSGAEDFIIFPIEEEEFLKKITKYLYLDIKEKKEEKEYIEKKEKLIGEKGPEVKPVEEVSEIAEVEEVKEIKVENFINPKIYQSFKDFLIKKVEIKDKKQIDKILETKGKDVYLLGEILNLPRAYIAQYIAEFLKIDYINYIDMEMVSFKDLSQNFCQKHNVLKITHEGEEKILLSNPFDIETVEILVYNLDLKNFKIAITEPENIENIFKPKESEQYVDLGEEISEFYNDKDSIILKKEAETLPIIALFRRILYKAVHQRATDIHIDPKEKEAIIRYRIDGDLYDVGQLTLETARKIVARCKILAKLDIAEKRKPQDGSFNIVIKDKTLNCRVATSSTPFGETVTIRLLQPEMKPKTLEELGMSERQANVLRELITRHSGFILVVGVTGSGKTTTVYSLLSLVDGRKRSILTIEDPVEYTIPYANQQQVNDKIGLTFEVLLRSAMRQDPDILFIGEIRDAYSASVAVSMASTGHLTIGTLHSANTTTAIWRLQMLDISKEKIAESVIAIVAQKLLKLLCPKCKKIREILPEEKAILENFTSDIPSKVAEPEGCPFCNYSGFYGRKAIYEVLQFDKEIQRMVYEGKPIYEIRSFIRQKGEPLLADSAILGVKNCIFSVEQIYKNVLLEEIEKKKEQVSETVSKTKKILVIDDDNFIRKVLSELLKKEGFEVLDVSDGIEALITLGKTNFDLVISDIEMPNLDGLKLLEILKQKEIKIPVVFISGRESKETELLARQKGAVEYIQKPINKQVIEKIKEVIYSESQRSH